MTHRNVFINETKWKCVTEISILYVKTRQRTLANYEEYTEIMSEVINISPKGKDLYQNVGLKFNNRRLRLYTREDHLDKI